LSDPTTGLTLSDGRLWMGVFGRCPLSYLSLEKTGLPNPLTLALDEAELELLIDWVAAVEPILEGAPSGSMQPLGWLSPRPLTLHVDAVSAKAPMLRLRWTLPGASEPFEVNLDPGAQSHLNALLTSRLSAARLARTRSPLLRGRASMEREGLRLENADGPQTLKIAPGLSHCWGPEGELVAPEELLDRPEVEVDSAVIEGQRFALRVQTLPQPMAASTAPWGPADLLLRQGQLARSRTERFVLLDTSSASEELLARVALSELLTLMLAGDYRAASRLWRGAVSDGPLADGIRTLDQRQVEPVLYAQLEAWLHSFNPDHSRARTAVDTLMGEIVSHTENRWVAARTLRNWRLHLDRLAPGADPGEPWKAACREYGVPIVPSVICPGWPGVRGNVPASESPWWKRLLSP
jgi:hypothetical protein